MENSIARTSKASQTKWRARLFMAGALFLGSAAVAQTIDDERRSLEAAKVQAAAADKRAAALEASAAKQTEQAEKVRGEAAAVAARIQSAESEINAAEARIRLIEQLRAQQNARLAAQQRPAVRLLAALQNIARRPPLLAIAQPGSTRDLVRVRAMLSVITPELQSRTLGLRREIAASRQLRVDSDRAVAALMTGQQKLGVERSRLAKIEAVYRAGATRLQGGALAEQDRAIALGEKARDIVELMDDLGEAAQVSARLETLTGPVLRPARPGDPRAAPLDGQAQANGNLVYRLPVTGTIRTGMGEVSDAGVRSRGLTIAPRPQAQVIAPARGRIVFAAPYRGYGQIIIIDHGGGWTTLVTGLAALQTRVGEAVNQGSPIGRAGNDRPSITVELRRGDQLVDIASIAA